MTPSCSLELTLSHLMRWARAKDVVVEVKDPNDFIVERWSRKLDANGVGVFQLPISDEPLLGDYVLKV
jgi:hypothetical protein